MVEAALATIGTRRSMGSHQSARMLTDTWLTPPHIITALGEFDLDPCCPPNMPWTTARVMWTERGLERDWFDRVWLNPPFSREAVHWLRKMVKHGDGIALTFARTETRWFFETIWRAATAVLFIEGRPYFHLADGTKAKANSGAPCVLAAYGYENAEILKTSGISGQFVRLK